MCIRDSVDDAQEENDSLSTARPLPPSAVNRLAICAGDDDYVAVDVPAGRTLTVTAEFTHASGDLDLALLSVSGAMVSSSTGTGDSETVSVTAVTAARYVARIYGYRGAENGYSLSITLTGGSACGDDPFEDNDSLAAATPSSPGSRSGRICAGDPDFFRWTLAAGQTLSTELTFIHASGDLDLRLYNAQGAVVASSTLTSDTERISHPILTAGVYTLEVYGWQNAANSYALDAAVSAPPLCADDATEPNDSAATMRIAPSGPAQFRICPFNDDWFTLALTGGETITATISFTHSLGDLDLRLYNADGSSVLGASVTSSDTETITWQAPTSMSVLWRVSGVAGAENGYTLQLSLIHI